jgi:SAM-dependent methyltransferase
MKALLRSLKHQIDDGTLGLVDATAEDASLAAKPRPRRGIAGVTAPRREESHFKVLDDVSDSERRAVLDALGEIEWNYRIDATKLSDTLKACLVRSSADEETAGFMLAQAQAGWLTRTAMSFAVDIFLLGMSLTDANGLLSRGRMCVTTSSQLRSLVTAARTHRATLSLAPQPHAASAASAEASSIGLSAAPAVSAAASSTEALSSASEPVFRMLNVGAGDGAVTMAACRALRVDPANVVATEASAPMVRALASHGLNAVQTCSLEHAEVARCAPYDIITIFNVLDRADDPVKLLRQARALLKPRTGLLVMAVVLPFRALVEDGSTKRAPSSPLPLPPVAAVPGVSFEVSANCLETHAFLPAVSTCIAFARARLRKQAAVFNQHVGGVASEMVLCVQGLRPLALSSVPYLCEGDGRRLYFSLRDAIFVLEPTQLPPAGGHAAQAAPGR